ncbi:MAG: hypothetical protein ACLP9L_04810 [Thermoguttaceae bacterium]
MPATAEFPAANIPGAELRFPAEQYVTLPNVPVFREHQTRAVDGRQLQFGMQQLQAVSNRCNRRIAETGDYAGIVIGHTPDPEDPNGQQPELVGYAGPFRMGTIGEGDRKCWAILADFHIMRQDLAKVRKHPRRSPELCLEDTYEEMFLDPIALLGAEAPRLDLGLVTGAQGGDGASQPTPDGMARKLYSFVRDGRRVEKYAMGACAMPSAGNVFTPSSNLSLSKTPSKKPQQYAANPQPETTSMLTPEDISAVVEAFLATDAGQFLVTEMKAKQGANAIVPAGQEPPADEIQPPADEIENPIAAAAETAPAGPKAPPETNPTPPSPEIAPPAEGGAPAAKKPEELPAAHAEPDGDEGEKAKKYAAACSSADGMSDGEMEKYLSQRWKHSPKWKKYGAAESASIEGGEKTPEGDVVQASGDPQGSGAAPPAKELKPTQLYSRLESKVQELQGQLTQEQIARKRVERYSRLQGLSAEFIMDPEDEMTLTEDMSDEQFERHVEKTVREHYQRNPVGLPWASPPDAATTHRDPSHPGHKPKETTQKDVDCAVEKYQRKRAAGESCDFAAILEEVKAGG